MKVCITRNSVLQITAENSTEIYALKKWLEENSEIYTNNKLNKSVDITDGWNSLKPKCE